MKVLVCGDRHWMNEPMISKFLDNLHLSTEGGIEIIDGHAKGADQFAHAWGKRNGTDIHCFPAEWNTYGPAAGPIRNSKMLKEGKPDLVVAFHDDLENSKGTKDMVDKARKAGVDVLVLTNDDDDDQFQHEV